MKKLKYTDSQIFALLKPADASTPMPERYRKHGMSSGNFYKWRTNNGDIKDHE